MLVENAKVLKNEEISEGNFSLSLYSPKICEEAKPGQIVQVKCSAAQTLRRPISICDCDKEKGILRLCFEIRGAGTEYMATLKENDEISLLGPLGIGYETQDVASRKILLVGGGIGTYPLLFCARELKANGAKPEALIAFKNKGKIVLQRDFEEFCEKVHIATDDGSCGFCGYAHQLLEKLTQNDTYDAIYICGPLAMLKGIAKIAESKNIPAFASLEERMGCGVGACLSCVCETKDENGEHHHERVCADGPVFDAKKLVLE